MLTRPIEALQLLCDYSTVLITSILLYFILLHVYTCILLYAHTTRREALVLFLEALLLVAVSFGVEQREDGAGRVDGTWVEVLAGVLAGFVAKHLSRQSCRWKCRTKLHHAQSASVSQLRGALTHMPDMACRRTYVCVHLVW